MAQALPDAAYVDSQYSLLQLSTMAEQGDARAAYLLGTRYASGRAGVRDDSQAVRWFKRAAELELPEAQFNLGVMYATGRGVVREPARAANWFRLSAEQGLADGQHAIGTLYASGTGVPRDQRKAAEWLGKAAAQAHAQAQFNLGVLYEFGQGVSRSPSRAKAWYGKAASGGYAPAAERLQRLRDSIAEVERSGPRRPSVRQPVATAPTTTNSLVRTPKLAVQPLTPTTKRVPKPLPPEPKSVAATTAKPVAKPVARVPRVDPTPSDPLAALAGLDDRRFTVQVISYHSRSRAAAAVRRYGLSEHARIYKKLSRGKTWYVVLYGEFASTEQAKAAIARLPEKLRRARPIVRKVATIRRQLRTQQGG